MSHRLSLVPALRSAALLCCLFGAACATVEQTAPPVRPAVPAVTAAPPPAPEPLPPATVEPPVPAVAGTSPDRKASGSRAVAPTAAPAKPPAAVTVAPTPRPPPAPVATPSAAAPRTPAPKPAAAKPAAPPLDLATLEVRLRETKAIGVLTKLSLKNQVDDLLDKFRAHYRRQAKTTLAELRRPYDMLLLKVLSLLQDSDPPLARDIVASREAIWGILADPEKFNEAKLMAGATP